MVYRILKSRLWFVVVLAGLVFSFTELRPTWEVPESLLHNQNVDFVSHQGNGPFATYLAMKVSYPPVMDIYQRLQLTERIRLKTRGEAHITLVTPPEYFDILRAHISMAEIENLLGAKAIQKSSFTPLCIGRGQITKGRKRLSTYYMVVQSEELLKLRRRIHQFFVERGGDPTAFVPEKYYPHITLGFTKRDLHLSDGVKKDQASCIIDLLVK